MRKKTAYIRLFTFLFLCGYAIVTMNCAPSDDYLKMYSAESKPPSYDVTSIKNLEYMGARIVNGGVNFAVYSERATRIELLLFSDPDSAYPSQLYEMSRYGNVYNIYITGIGRNTYYAYRAWGPNWKYDPSWYPGSIRGFASDVDSQGNRFNPNKVLVDPYAKAIHRDHNWTAGNAASGPYRLESTIAASSKSIVVDDSRYNWSENENTYWNKKKAGNTLSPEKIIKYEVNVKGLTMNSGSYAYGVSHPGTYRGAGEMAGYFKELGVTGVELLPIHEAPGDGGYWKYWTIGFLAPEITYSWAPERASQVDEFKWMVEQFHKHDIEVYIDVVYNHTGEGGLWREKPPKFTNVNINNPDDFWYYDPPETATMLNFRALDNNAYYQRSPYDSNSAQAGYYWEHTGTGNGMRANHTPFRRLILDSLRYWNDVMHVDGFRFDLCAQLAETDLDYNNWSNSDTVIKDIVNDSTLQRNNARLFAEPWDAGGHYKVGEFPKAATSTNWAGKGSLANDYSWYEWNGQFRDYMRSLMNDESYKLNTKVWPYINDFGSFWLGSSAMLDPASTSCTYCERRYPYSTVNFITAHDGFTLYDVFSYNEKRNCGGPLNPECVDPNSGDNNNHSKYYTNPLDKRKMVRNAAVLLFLSAGTPMMLGGDEWMRTQFGNNNAYHTGADNEYNWFRWGNWENELDNGVYARAKSYDFFKGIIKFRKDRCYAFCRTQFDLPTSIFKAYNNPATDPGGLWSGKALGLYYHSTVPGMTGQKRIYVAINMELTDRVFELPTDVTTWKVRIDTQSFFEGSGSGKLSGNICGSAGNPDCSSSIDPATANDYTVKAQSVVVFEEL
jgi:isoamylase